MTDTDRWERELQFSWPLLSPRTRTEITTVPVPTSTPEPMRVGVDGGGARHLLVPLQGTDLRGDDGESALAMRVRTYTFGRIPARFLDVVCARPDLFEKFDKVLAEILLGVEASPSTAAATTVEVVRQWRSLLATRSSSLLTMVAQMGLFAELTVLDLAASDGRVETAWWRGPRQEPHDIVLPARALEVKAVGSSSTSIEIHGLHQLEAPQRPLALVVLTLTEADEGRTLPDLVEEMLGRFDNRGEAIQLLSHAGYSRVDADRYTERFTITDAAIVEIDDSVPRIVPGSFGPSGVPLGLCGVVYRIQLSALAPRIQRGLSAIHAWIEAAA